MKFNANECGSMTLSGKNESSDPITRRMNFGHSASAMAIAGIAVLFAVLLYASAAEAQSFGNWEPAVSVDPGGINMVNTAALEGCPIESPDGRTLFFASNRPGGKGGIDIWVAYRESDHHPWGEPANLPEPVNSAFDDFCPTPLPGGRLLFVSRRGSICGFSADIFQTRLHPVWGWLDPENLGCDVNSSGDEFSPSFVEADGQTMLFFSSGRDGLQNIYMSVLQPDGSWGAADPVEELNTPFFNDARPNVRKDGLEIVFDSDRPGGLGGFDIYAAVRSSIFEPWSEPEPLGPNVNSVSSETRASLSRDGRRLYFGSNRPGGEENSDIYVSSRSGPGHRWGRESLPISKSPSPAVER